MPNKASACTVPKRTQRVGPSSASSVSGADVPAINAYIIAWSILRKKAMTFGEAMMLW